METQVEKRSRRLKRTEIVDLENMLAWGFLKLVKSLLLFMTIDIILTGETRFSQG